MTDFILALFAISLAFLLAGTIYFMPSGGPAREAIPTTLTLPLMGIIAVLVGGYRA